ncbi:MAG: HU family DNA-binding protein [Methanococcaceae archaeon]
MTKADIVDIIAAGTGVTKLETEVIVEGFLNTVIESLKEGKGIEIRGFGSYKVKKKNARFARNPKTGEKVFVEEHFVPSFKFSKDFKSIVDKGRKEEIVTL